MSIPIIPSLRRHFHILIHTAMVVLPLLAFTAILLGLVYWNLWDRRPGADVSLDLNSGYESNILYVNYPATSLILVASWSSSVSIPLIGSLLTLISFVVAAELLWTSDKFLNSLLPTATQLGLLTELLDGRKLALWTWFSAFWRPRDQRIPSRWVIDLAVGIQLAGISFSLAIIAADTWLHVATSSTTLWYLDIISDPSTLAPSYEYSRNFRDACSDIANDPCSVKLKENPAVNQTSFPDDIKALLTNTYFDTTFNRSADGSLFLAPRLPNQASLGGKENPSFQTFTATTIGVNVACDSSLDSCTFSQTNTTSGDWQFACPDGMKGTLTPGDWLAISSWWRPNTSDDVYDATWSYYETNFTSDTIELGIVALLQDVTVMNTSNINLPSASWIPSSNVSVIGTRCEVRTMNTSYSWTNMTTAPVMIGSSPNTTGGALARAALLAGYFDSSSFDQDQKSKLGSILNQASPDKQGQLGTVKAFANITTTGMVQQVQYLAGLVGLGLLGGTFEPAPATKLALANSAIVTQVKKAPLFTLVILNLWYAGFAICLGCLTIYILRDRAVSQDIKEIRDLVTINGLATSMVGRHMENLASKGADARIGVEKVDGSWRFRIFESPGAEEGKALLSTEENTE